MDVAQLLAQKAAYEAALQQDQLPAVRDLLHAQLALINSQIAESNIATGNVISGDLVQAQQIGGINIGLNKGHVSVQMFFGTAPPPDQLELLDAYLRFVRDDCLRLRLDRLTDKQHNGLEQSTLPISLTLRDVYIALTTTTMRRTARARRLDLAGLQARLAERQPDLVPAEWVRRAHIVTPFQPLSLDDQRGLVVLERPELVLEALAHERRLVLLGDPGSGKSTVLRYVALLLAEALLAGRSSLPMRGWRLGARALPIPVLCPLGAVAAELEGAPSSNATRALWRVLERSIEGVGGTRSGLLPYLHGAFRRGAALVLCDGLDEIPVVDAAGRPLRSIIADAVRELSRELSAATIVLTCRVRPYRDPTGTWQLRASEGWSERVIAPLAFGQVRLFVRRWYEQIAARHELPPGDAARRAKDLVDVLERNERVRRLTESPLLLTMLALVHLNRTRLPEDRAELYDECVELLLDRWEPSRSWAISRRPGLLERLNIPDLKRENLRAELHAMAYDAHLQPPSADGRGLIDGATLEGRLLRFFRRLKVPDDQLLAKHGLFLDVLRDETGLLQPVDGDVYALPHLTFEEYLAACYLADRTEMNALAADRWMSADRERWREVLLLMMGRLHQQGKAADKGIRWVRFLCQRRSGREPKSPLQRQQDGLFAAECYAEMGGTAAIASSDLDIDLIETDLAASLVEIITTHPPVLSVADRVRAADLLGSALPDLRAGVCTVEPAWCEIPAGVFVMGSRPDDPNASAAETPCRSIDLPAYAIARYPVTNWQYAEFVRDTGELPPLYADDER